MTITISVDEAIARLDGAGPIQPPLAQALSGTIETWSRSVFTAEERAVSTGFWKTEPGTSRWDFSDRGEIIHVLAGAMTVHEDDGVPLEVTAGDVVVFPFGWSGVWTVTQTLTKFYVIYR
ncbi:cupin domain-containing protein [Leifsonia sp. 2MCAF36]|uniref:cupin domain-containing protein n=1 Tax=Leifsonia sp. 2MCAF36 TaxID=3232988 RepID=UPI003F9C6949